MTKLRLTCRSLMNYEIILILYTQAFLHANSTIKCSVPLNYLFIAQCFLHVRIQFLLEIWFPYQSILVNFFNRYFFFVRRKWVLYEVSSEYYEILEDLQLHHSKSSNFLVESSLQIKQCFVRSILRSFLYCTGPWFSPRVFSTLF